MQIEGLILLLATSVVKAQQSALPVNATTSTTTGGNVGAPALLPTIILTGAPGPFQVLPQNPNLGPSVLPSTVNPAQPQLQNQQPQHPSPPSVQVPGPAAPGTASPNVQMPGSVSPGSASPNVQMPGTVSSGSASPNVQMPGSVQPGSASPNVQMPGNVSPGSTSPLPSMAPAPAPAGAPQAPASTPLTGTPADNSAPVPKSQVITPQGGSDRVQGALNRLLQDMSVATGATSSWEDNNKAATGTDKPSMAVAAAATPQNATTAAHSGMSGATAGMAPAAESNNKAATSASKPSMVAAAPAAPATPKNATNAAHSGADKPLMVAAAPATPNNATPKNATAAAHSEIGKANVPSASALRRMTKRQLMDMANADIYGSRLQAAAANKTSGAAASKPVNATSTSMHTSGDEHAVHAAIMDQQATTQPASSTNALVTESKPSTMSQNGTMPSGAPVMQTGMSSPEAMPMMTMMSQDMNGTMAQHKKGKAGKMNMSSAANHLHLATGSLVVCAVFMLFL